MLLVVRGQAQTEPFEEPAGAATTAAAAQPAAKPAAAAPLIERTPFDVMLLKKESGGNRLEVLPLALPQRPLARVPANGAIKVRLLDRPAEDFEVSWANVAQVRVFEQMLLDEAQRLAAAGQFDEAYDYFRRLHAEYPSLAGLNTAVSDFLRRNALALYQAKDYDRALAVLITLRDHDAKYAGLPSAVETVIGEILSGYLRDDNYAAARQVLGLWQTRFSGLAVESAAKWQQRFEIIANEQLAEARRLLAQKQYIPARKAVARAIGIWPELPAAKTVAAQIEREFPFVTVGVLQTAPRHATHQIDQWSAIRASRLTERLIAEQVDYSPEGGVYRSAFGELQLDESGRELRLKVDSQSPGAPTTDALARFLLGMAEPGKPQFRSDFASLLSGVSLGEDNSVAMQFGRVHVRPEAMLQLPPPEGGTADYAMSDYSQEQVTFTLARPAASDWKGPQTIVELTMADDETAVAALLSGEIDVLDRVPPWQLARLKNVAGIQVGTYRLPTVHVLIPNLKNPLVAKREFRRALCYGIDRAWILERVLLGGTPQMGFNVLSAPFPTGRTLTDPVRYAYNDQIAPRSFEPRLAAILATVAWAAVQNPTGKNKEAELPPLPELTLAHPNEPVARVACQSIQAQLVREGIPLKLLEVSADDLMQGKVKCDLRYAELAVWEPLVDIRTILGPGGLAGDVHSPYINTALRNLDAATNWSDVRARLAELHRTLHHELPVIPLWQTVNSFAYRTSLRGIGNAPLTLYQNVGEWSLTSGSENVASLETSSQP
jgi:tetratricopeptide (TPR) repeat protein